MTVDALASDIDVDLLPAQRMAALIAPVVDRLRLSSYRVTMQRASALAQANGLEQSTMMMIGYLRNLVPDRIVARSAIQALFTYQSDHQDAMKPLDVLAGRALVEYLDGDCLRLTDSGAALAVQLHALGDAVVNELWGDDGERVSTLLALAERAVNAGAADGGPGFELMTPPESASAHLSAAGSLAEQLTGLRFHRFDAHIAAWRSVGLLPHQIKALAPGSARDEIEAETNRRAATPYLALSRDERLAFLAGVAALRN